MSRIHLIAIGGSAMHNLALALKKNGHVVTGSDDEIYEPAKSRLAEHGLLPDKMGWFVEKIHPEIDFIILGMHARNDNPELIKAQNLCLKIYSYPSFLFEYSKNKKRLVIAGSHGKTSTTAMVLNALQFINKDFDYLVGAQLEGFELMASLSDADIIVIEGDEYLSSSIDRIPKIHHYIPHVSIITGIAWDHINVFPTFENYIVQFQKFIELHAQNATIIYYAKDTVLRALCQNSVRKDINFIPYSGLPIDEEKRIVFADKAYAFNLIGEHNLQNAQGALLLCKTIGISEDLFLSSLKNYTGAAKRLQRLKTPNDQIAFLDFAHAPSKVKATASAVKDWFRPKELIAVLELHTFSSLNKTFIPQYAHSLDAADKALVYFDKHTLTMKQMPPLDEEYLKKSFCHSNLEVYSDKALFHAALDRLEKKDKVVLYMSSGNFGNYDLSK